MSASDNDGGGDDDEYDGEYGEHEHQSLQGPVLWESFTDPGEDSSQT